MATAWSRASRKPRFDWSTACYVTSVKRWWSDWSKRTRMSVPTIHTLRSSLFFTLSLLSLSFYFSFSFFFYFFYFSLSSPFSQTSRSRPVFRRRLRSSTVQNEGTLLGKVFSIERNAHPPPSPSPRIKTQDKLDLPPPPSPTLLFCPHYDRE